MTDEFSIDLPDESSTRALAQCMAAALCGGQVVYLEGELGAGKTTFARALLAALGVAERIKSPTYSLLESYSLSADRRAWHLDLYRIADAGELEWLGLDELHNASALVLIEWPERGGGWLPVADVNLALRHAGAGRKAGLLATSDRGRQWLQRVQD